MTALSESSERAPRCLRDTPGQLLHCRAWLPPARRHPWHELLAWGGTGLGESCFGVAGEGTAGIRVAAGTCLIGTEAEKSLGSTWEE